MATCPRSGRRTGSGFTLLELLVVVAFVGLISAIVVPAVLGRMDGEREVQRIEQAPPEARVIDVDGARAPATERADVTIAIRARAVLDGLDVISRYQARFDGRFVVRNRDAEAGRIAVAVPFPPGLAEARDVSLGLERGGVALPEPDDVVYDTDGIRWTMALPPGEAVTIAVSYTGVGQGALRYDVAGAGRTGEVHVAIEVEGADASVPLDALEPTEPLRWDYRGLVTSRAIVVELSPGAAPLGQAVDLLRLAGIAVLVFGAGFWYLSALDRRGRLDRFRWGHFLLLAIDYMLWFALAAIGIARGAAPLVAAAGASAVALPLLALHVARMLDRRFALTRALPLAIVTLAGVLAAVLLHAERGVLLAGALIAAAAGLTLTYRTFLVRGEEARQRRADQRAAEAAARKAAQDREAADERERRAAEDRQRAIEREHERARRTAGTHCAACGASGAASPFCASCGTPRAVTLPSPRCATPTQLAPHLLIRGWERRELHCTACGDRLAA